MINTFLVALFLVNGNVVMHPKFPVLVQDSLEVCESRLERNTKFVDSQVPDSIPFVVDCISGTEAEMDAQLQEMIVELKRQAGEPA